MAADILKNTLAVKILISKLIQETCCFRYFKISYTKVIVILAAYSLFGSFSEPKIFGKRIIFDCDNNANLKKKD